MGYLVGLYIRKFCDEEKERNLKKNCIFVTLFLIFYFCSSFMYFMIMQVEKNNLNFFIAGEYWKKIFDGMNYAVFCPGAGIFLFLIFRSIKPFTNKTINSIAGTTFGIYLIHDSSLRDVIWNVTHIEQLYHSSYFPIFALGVGITLFAVCSVIELFRQYIFKIFSHREIV